jgi:hypothetical protein
VNWPSLEDERELLAALRRGGIREVFPAGWEMPVQEIDQFEAATKEAEKFQARYRAALAALDEGVNQNFVERDQETDPLVVCGIMRSMAGWCCEHGATGSFRPMFALLAPRVFSCRACLPGAWDRCVASDVRKLAGEDTLCDLCLEESQVFQKFSIQAGPVVLAGDACEDCIVLLGGS